MSEVLLANLFFIITGVAVLVVAGFLCVLAFHAVKLTKMARRVLEKVESGAETLAEDARVLRRYARSGNVLGRILTTTIRAVVQAARPRGPASRRTRGGESDTDEL